MRLITCPSVRPSEEVEFSYGGQAHVGYPAEPATVSGADWAQFLSSGQPQRPVRQAMEPRRRFRRWFNAAATPAPTIPGHFRPRAETCPLSPTSPAAAAHPNRRPDRPGRLPALHLRRERDDRVPRTCLGVLANGVHQVSTSIIYGRRRGVWPPDWKTPTRWSRSITPTSEPMLTATTVPLTDGLVAPALPGRAAATPPPTRPAMTPSTRTPCAGDRRRAGRARRAGRRPIRCPGDAAGQAGDPAVPCSDPSSDRRGPAGDWIGRVTRNLPPTPMCRCWPGPTRSGFATTVRSAPCSAAPTASTTHRKGLPSWSGGPGPPVILATGAREHRSGVRRQHRSRILLAGAARTYLHRYGVLRSAAGWSCSPPTTAPTPPPLTSPTPGCRSPPW